MSYFPPPDLAVPYGQLTPKPHYSCLQDVSCYDSVKFLRNI